MTGRRGAVRAVGLALAAVLACTTACGIPMQDEPVPLPSGAVPPDITAP